MGWFAGQIPAANDYHPDAGFRAVTEQVSQRRMVWGVAIGSGIGLSLGLLDLLSLCRESAQPGASAREANCPH
jgi:hypothetical protein